MREWRKQRFICLYRRTSLSFVPQSPPPLCGAPSRREPWKRSPPHIRLLPQSTIYVSLLPWRRCRGTRRMRLFELYLIYFYLIRLDLRIKARSIHLLQGRRLWRDYRPLFVLLQHKRFYPIRRGDSRIARCTAQINFYSNAGAS